MDTILLPLDQTRLRNGEHVQLHTQFRQIIGTDPAVVAALQPVLASYDAIRADLNKVYAQDQASDLTPQIETVDAERDDYLTGFLFHNKAMTYSPTQSIRDGARALLHQAGIYGDNIQRQSINAETAAITNLLDDFSNNPQLAAALTATGTQQWIAPLAAANQKADALFQQRAAQQGAGRLPFTTKEKRAELAGAYDKVARRLESNYDMANGGAPWDKVVSTLNEILQKYKDLMATREGRNEDDNTPQ